MLRKASQNDLTLTLNQMSVVPVNTSFFLIYFNLLEEDILKTMDISVQCPLLYSYRITKAELWEVSAVYKIE